MQYSRDMKMDGVSEQEGCAGPHLMNRSYPGASENSTALRLVLAHKSLHQFFYYHNKYLNSMKCQETSMGPSKCTIQCTKFCTLPNIGAYRKFKDFLKQTSWHLKELKLKLIQLHWHTSNCTTNSYHCYTVMSLLQIRIIVTLWCHYSHPFKLSPFEDL
jgi:hypothetical protein